MASPIITVSQMREWEQATWAAGITEESVIERVGGIVAARLLEMTRAGERILLLAGKGNNGNDVRHVLPHLEDRKAKLVDVRDPIQALEELKPLLKDPPDWIVDGLFGIGLNRPLSGEWQRLVQAINETGANVFSVDTPSGLNGESGEIEGAAIRADVTLTLGAAKRGLLRPSAAGCVGRLEVAPEIGLVSCPCESDLLWTEAKDFEKFPPRRKADSHKGTYGHLGIIAGSLGFHGAAVLTIRSAMKARPGLITLQTGEEVYPAIAAQTQAAMARPWRANDSVQGNFTALLIGPGLAGETVSSDLVEEVKCIWREAEATVVVDASALDWLPAGSVPPDSIRVITPHPGEAARLLKTSPREVQQNRVGAVRNLSEKFGNCRVVLKGHQTLIGRREGEIYVNSSGGPGLAQGGSGDILAGFLGGLLAQPLLRKRVGETLRYAVWEHGATADRLDSKHRNWTTEDLAGELGDGVVTSDK